MHFTAVAFFFNSFLLFFYFENFSAWAFDEEDCVVSETDRSLGFIAYYDELGCKLSFSSESQQNEKKGCNYNNLEFCRLCTVHHHYYDEGEPYPLCPTYILDQMSAAGTSSLVSMVEGGEEQNGEEDSFLQLRCAVSGKDRDAGLDAVTDPAGCGSDGGETGGEGMVEEDNNDEGYGILGCNYNGIQDCRLCTVGGTGEKAAVAVTLAPTLSGAGLFSKDGGVPEEEQQQEEEGWGQGGVEEAQAAEEGEEDNHLTPPPPQGFKPCLAIWERRCVLGPALEAAGAAGLLAARVHLGCFHTAAAALDDDAAAAGRWAPAPPPGCNHLGVGPCRLCRPPPPLPPTADPAAAATLPEGLLEGLDICDDDNITEEGGKGAGEGAATATAVGAQQGEREEGESKGWTSSQESSSSTLRPASISHQEPAGTTTISMDKEEERESFVLRPTYSSSTEQPEPFVSSVSSSAAQPTATATPPPGGNEEEDEDNNNNIMDFETTLLKENNGGGGDFFTGEEETVEEILQQTTSPEEAAWCSPELSSAAVSSADYFKKALKKLKIYPMQTNEKGNCPWKIMILLRDDVSVACPDLKQIEIYETLYTMKRAIIEYEDDVRKYELTFPGFPCTTRTDYVIFFKDRNGCLLGQLDSHQGLRSSTRRVNR